MEKITFMTTNIIKTCVDQSQKYYLLSDFLFHLAEFKFSYLLSQFHLAWICCFGVLFETRKRRRNFNSLFETKKIGKKRKFRA